MAYKCRICGSNDVANPGDICELCAIGQDPYASAMQNNNGFSPQPQSTYQHNADSYNPSKGRNRKVLLGGGATLNNTDPYGNTIVPQEEESVQVYSAGQAPTIQNTGTMTVSGGASAYSTTSNNANAAKGNSGALTSGITKNISVDTQKRSALVKIGRSLFKGIPFSLDDEITMFQVFPDYSGTSLNAMGNACDQVIVYGKVNAGAVAENNDVEIYGHRDADNNVVAKKIVNKASGTTVTPDRIIPVGVIWGITIAVFIAIFLFVATCGVEGIVWAVILVLCLTNLPLVFKIILGIFGFLFSFMRRMF